MIRPAAALLLALIVATAAGAAGEAVTARLKPPAGTHTVGDPVILELRVTHPPGTVLDPPDALSLMPEGSPPPFVVESIDPVETSPPRADETVWSVRVRPFATGELTVPGIRLSYRPPDSTEVMSVAAAPVGFSVQSVLTGEDESPADIKSPWSLPVEWWRIAGLLALLAVLLAAALLLYRKYRRRAPVERPIEPAPAGPVESPYERAVRELERLLASDLLPSGRVKEFHVALSEIVKRFLGESHRFDALDRTSEEVLGDLSGARVAPETIGRARVFLSACDLVKFARHRAAGTEIDETISAARELIETGKPAPQPEKEVAA